jgi:ketosteroid isomerase-like protein
VTAVTELHPVDLFGRAFALQDIDALAELLTEDCVFEDTTPPSGRRVEGREQVLGAFRDFFATSPTARFVTEHRAVADGFAVVEWRYTWDGGADEPGHVRGVDVFTLEGGRIAAKRSYVKG